MAPSAQRTPTSTGCRIGRHRNRFHPPICSSCYLGFSRAAFHPGLQSGRETARSSSPSQASTDYQRRAVCRAQVRTTIYPWVMNGRPGLGALPSPEPTAVSREARSLQPTGEACREGALASNKSFPVTKSSRCVTLMGAR